MTNKTCIVKSGDTLSGIITRFYGSSTPELIKKVSDANHIADPNVLEVGDVLLLPGEWSAPKTIPPEITRVELTPHEIKSMVSREGPSPTMEQHPLGAGEYWAKQYTKDVIVLHFTAGYTWQSAYNTFMGPGRVATPFIVDTSGKIIQLFDSKFWAPHTGIPGDNNAIDHRSIGIEIVNIGPVWKKDGVWKDYVGKTHPEGDVIVGADRGTDGGMKFPAGQVKAVCWLVNHLCIKYGIQRQVPKEKIAYQYDKLKNFKGITTHQMFRKDKYDLGVGFKPWWPQLIEQAGLKEV